MVEGFIKYGSYAVIAIFLLRDATTLVTRPATTLEAKKKLSAALVGYVALEMLALAGVTISILSAVAAYGLSVLTGRVFDSIPSTPAEPDEQEPASE